MLGDRNECLKDRSQYFDIVVTPIALLGAGHSRMYEQDLHQMDPGWNFHYKKSQLVLASKRLAQKGFNRKMFFARFFIWGPCETILR